VALDPKPLPHVPDAASCTLGILAGGRATRLGGRDKAWEICQGRSLIERTSQAFIEGFAERLVSANRDAQRYAALGLRVVADRVPDRPGPLAGIDALLAACGTPWLLTVPVDLRWLPCDLGERLFSAGEVGAVAQDTSGVQPLVALWPVARSKGPVADALARGDGAVHHIIARLSLPMVHFDGADFGNLNTPVDFPE
jgi:molybdopterin-guanine dinucleotide biosynthesis protein A